MRLHINAWSASLDRMAPLISPISLLLKKVLPIPRPL
jgi:hypothetical protein